jgi:hypothetical protein
VGAGGFCKLGVVNCCNLQIVPLTDCNAALVFFLMCSSSWEGTTMLLILMDDVSTVNSQVASTSTRSTRRGFGPVCNFFEKL